MFLKIKNRVEKELSGYIKQIANTYRLNRLSPALFNNIKEFISRDGKRVRPVLFVIGYLGFKTKPASGLYRSAVSLELLHDFMLVHDDIIDKSDTRRGKPSMHAALNKYLLRRKNIKFSGKDLAIVAGDIMYAMALDAFLAVKENPRHKELSLRKLISAVLYTGSGEFIELLLGTKPVGLTTKEDIYKIYDYKTANYTFASPLAMGATLAGAKNKEVGKLFEYGMCLGRAFQIKDDIIGTFSESKKIGKSNLTDLKEAKRTILIWYAYNHSGKSGKTVINDAFSGKKIKIAELREIRKVIVDSGGLDYAKNEIKRLLNKSRHIIKSSRMRGPYLQALIDFSEKTLQV